MLLFTFQVVSDSFGTLWTVAHQPLLSMGFSRQQYWSRLPFTSPGELPDLGSKPVFPALADEFFTTEAWGKPTTHFYKGENQKSSFSLGCVMKLVLLVVQLLTCQTAVEVVGIFACAVEAEFAEWCGWRVTVTHSGQKGKVWVSHCPAGAGLCSHAHGWPQPVPCHHSISHTLGLLPSNGLLL